MPPIPVEIADRISVYDPVKDTWYEGTWNLFSLDSISKYAAINLNTAGNHTIIEGTTGSVIRITSIILTVGGETNITLYDGSLPISGPLDFGGSSEPRGMVSNFAANPLRLSNGNSLIINSSAAVQVSGIVCYTQK